MFTSDTNTSRKRGRYNLRPRKKRYYGSPSSERRSPSRSPERKRKRARKGKHTKGRKRSTKRKRARSPSGNSPARKRRKLTHRRRDTPSPSVGSSCDNAKEGLLQYKKGDRIRDGRYEVIRLAGQGTFGTVLEVYDTKHKEYIGLKVVRSVKRYLDAAYIEIDILDKLRKTPGHNGSSIVKFFGSFKVKHRRQEHVCLAFQLLGRSLYDFIKRNKYQGYTKQHVWEYARQIFKAIKFCHQLKLTHTDLKPENILLVDDSYSIVHKRDGTEYRVPRRTDIKLIDFGGATFETDHHAKMVNTRQYRGPEVILGLGWSYASDLWSVGCILVELYTGRLLFATHEDTEHLALMQKALSKPFPAHMGVESLVKFRQKYGNSPPAPNTKRGRSASIVRVDNMFSETGELMWPSSSCDKESLSHLAKAKTLEDRIDDVEMCSLIRDCLTYDPTKRISAEEALSRYFDNPQHIPTPRSQE